MSTEIAAALAVAQAGHGHEEYVGEDDEFAFEIYEANETNGGAYVYVKDLETSGLYKVTLTAEYPGEVMRLV